MEGTSAMGIFGNSFGVSQRLEWQEFIRELDKAAADKLAQVYSNQPTKLKLCAEITGLSANQSIEVLKVVSLIIINELALAFPKSDDGTTKSGLIARQEGILAMAGKLPDIEFMNSLILMMKIHDKTYFNNHPELNTLANELFEKYSLGTSIYEAYFTAHFS